jgi:hypothetical protein
MTGSMVHVINLPTPGRQPYYQDVKYSFIVQRRGPDSLVLSLRGEDLIDARIRERSDGVLLAIWGGHTHEIDGLEEPLGLRMVLDGQTWLLPNQFDPSELRTDVTGKLIRFLQDNGGEVVAGKAYAEVEAMKMVMPLIATESGKISHLKSGGAVIEAGDMLGSLTLKDPNKVKKISAFGGEFRASTDDGADAPPSAAEALEDAIASTNLILDGYVLPVDETVNNLLERLCDPALPEVDGGRWQRACNILNGIVDRYLAVESLFAGKKEDSVIRDQTRKNIDSLDVLLKLVVAHARIKQSTVGLYKLNAVVDPKLESARFQALNLKCAFPGLKLSLSNGSSCTATARRWSSACSSKPRRCRSASWAGPSAGQTITRRFPTISANPSNACRTFEAPTTASSRSPLPTSYWRSASLPSTSASKSSGVSCRAVRA